jgi:hypothetical protein
MGKVYARGGEPAMILSDVGKLAAMEFRSAAFTPLQRGFANERCSGLKPALRRTPAKSAG